MTEMLKNIKAFDPSKYTNNSARPLPVILLLDRSGSMGKEYNLVTGGVARIDILNKAVNEMIASFKNVSNNDVEIDVGIISFGGDVSYDIKLSSANNISNIALSANGNTPMGGALKLTKSLIEDKSIIPSKGYRPTIVLVSDGEPNDDWESAMNDFVSNGRTAKCERFALAIGTDADKSVLGKFVSSGNEVQEAKDASKIRSFFKFVTMSVTKRTKSQNPNILLPQEEVNEILKEILDEMEL